jgi:hypothetical protein
VECKGLDINQHNPHLLGVACGDPYVRLFDRRRLSTCEWWCLAGQGCVLCAVCCVLCWGLGQG